MWVLVTGSHTAHHWQPASGEVLGALQAASPEPAPLPPGGPPALPSSMVPPLEFGMGLKSPPLVEAEAEW